MRQWQIFGLWALLGAATIAALAEGDLLLALIMGAVLGMTVAVVIVAFPLDLSYREPPRSKREVHVVMVDQRKK